MRLSKTFLVAVGLVAVVAAASASAAPSFSPAEVKNPQGNKVASVAIPEHAVELAPYVYSLGLARDVDGALVEGYMFVHPKDGKAKPPWAGGGGSGKGESKCYAFLARDARWKVTEPYLLNPANGDGLSSAFVSGSFATSVDEWDNQVSFDIFGAGSTTSDPLAIDTVTPDGDNEVYFGAISDPGVIAVTITWGVYGGPPSGRYLSEWDMVFDDPDFTWGDAGANPGLGLMDFQNIAVHELGHAAGMGHPDDSCTEETMYRFASADETKKRDLNAGDIASIKELYK